jgi:peptidoglycan/LPS O-acetylase OafA/YrhL
MVSATRIFGLDLMRSVAIILVCLLHGREILSPYFPNFPNLWYIDGVDLFFSLSGFLIGTIFIREFSRKSGFFLKDVANFWIRRWFRTLPNYYLILGINILLFYLRTKHFEIEGLWKYFIFAQNLNVVQCFHFFPESWSLAIEEWFYLTFPLICVLMVIFFNIKTQKAILVSTLFIIIISILIRNLEVKGMPVLTIGDWIREFRNTVVFRLDSIVYGVLGAYLSLYHKRIWSKPKLLYFILGLLGILLISNFYPLKSNLFLVNYDAFSSIIILLLLPYLSEWKSISNKLIEWAVTWISKISYSMYLVNASIIFINLNNYNKAQNAKEAVFNYFIFWFLTFGLSYLLYSFFEKPTTALRDKFSIS